MRPMPAVHDRPLTEPSRTPTARGEPRPARGLALPRVSVGKLMLRFALTGLAALAILAAVTAVVSRRMGTSQAVDEARRIAALATKGVVEPAITPGLLAGDPAAHFAFDRVVRSGVLQGSLRRVKLWSGDGRIVYSDEPRLIGEVFPFDADKVAALNGGPAEAEVSDLAGPENRFEKPGTKLLEVYTPAVGPGGEKLLFETYFSYGAVTDSGRRLWQSFAPVVLGALLLLQLFQLPLAWSLARGLRRGQEERERLLWHAVDSSDAERRRIASDLHDGTVQDLAGVSLTLSAAARRADGPRDAAGGQADSEVLTNAAFRVRSAIASLRSLLVDIYPPDLDEKELEPVLSDLVARLDARGITPHVSVNLADRPIATDSKALVYRCAQELVRNTVRHSGASHLWLTVSTLENRLILEVADDGRGFDPRDGIGVSPDGHVGLRVLADLVAEVGGEVAVASAPGKGTSTRVEVPI
jgi:two-component system NarL family sensor kinase